MLRKPEKIFGISVFEKTFYSFYLKKAWKFPRTLINHESIC